MIKPEELQPHLDTLTPKDWKPLFELIPIIESSKEFGTPIISDKLDNGSIIFPYWSESDIVFVTFRAANDLGIILNYDWGAWKEGSEMLKDENYDYSTLDSITLCKLLTIITRKDRFVDGYKILCFKNKSVLKILKSLKYNIKKNTSQNK